MIDKCDQQPLGVPPPEEKNGCVMWGKNGRRETSELTAPVGLGEGCGETKENDWVEWGFGNVFCLGKVRTGSHTE